MAISLKEPGYTIILDVLLVGDRFLPAPVLLEYRRVLLGKGPNVQRDGEALLNELLSSGVAVEGFLPADGDAASKANVLHGKGNGRGGTLNFGDLMVFAIAQRLAMPILCTGRDFRKAGANLHPASRDW